MCVVSMVGDHYADKWGQKRYPYKVYPDTTEWPGDRKPFNWPGVTKDVTRQEFDALKKEVAEMVALLKRAKKYDADNNEPDCEIEDKMALLRKVAKLVGVDLDAALATAAQ